jgi:hypothetical protein
MVVLCLFERMPIHQFERIADGPEPNDSEFAAPANAAAQSLGLICAGTYKQSRGGAYQCLQTFWYSPDYTTQITVGGGKILNTFYKKLRLSSECGDRILETTNEYGLTDMSGLIDREVIMDGSLRTLYALHVSRLAVEAEPATAFDVDPLQEQERMLLRTYQASAERGWMRPLDHQQSVFKYTLKAGLYQSTIGFWSSVRRGLEDESPSRKVEPASETLFPK